MASSVSRQDEPNRALWLVTRAGKMEPSCLLGTTRCIPQAKFHQKPYNKSFIEQVCSVKMAGYWRRSLFASLWTSTLSRSINTQKRTWPISSHLDRTNLVNNPYKWYLSEHGNYGKIYYTMITTTQFIWPQEHWLGAHIRNIQPTTFSICQFIFQLPSWQVFYLPSDVAR